MTNFLVKFLGKNEIRQIGELSRKCAQSQRFYTTYPDDARDEKPKSDNHPYKKIHPWKSIGQFSQHLVSSVVYNEDGLVAINKPYGISAMAQVIANKRPTGIVNEVPYTLQDAMPNIAKELGYPNLKLIKSPEKFISGIALFAADEKVEEAVEKSLKRAQGTSILPRTFWIVTTRVPNEIKGEKRLAMKLKPDPTRSYKLPTIITSWSIQERKQQLIKILNVQFNTISNSTDNMCSLVQIKPSTLRWHAIRLFAATVLYSPILGDNIYGSRVKLVMGKWMNISPFVEAASMPQKLDKYLLSKLKLSSGKESIVPAHIHLKEMFLPGFKRRDNSLTITAPPRPEFMWTCKKLEFKHSLFETTDNCNMVINNGEARVHQAVN